MPRSQSILIRPRFWILVISSILVVALGVWLALPAWKLHQASIAARSALAKYDFASAREQIQAGLTIRPRETELLLLGSQAARRDGDLAEAKDRLDAFREISDSTPESTLQYALLACQRGELEKVQTYLVEQLEQADDADKEQILESLALGCVRVYLLDRADAWVAELLDRFPRNPIGRLLKAQTLQTLRDESKAQEVFESLVQDFPRHVIARRHLATQLVHTQKFAQAAEHFRELTQQLPDEAWPLIGLLRCLRQLNETEERREILDRLRREYPDHPTSLLEQGRAALEANQVDEAERLLREAVRLAPSEAEHHYQLGMALRRNQKLNEAEEELQRFKQINSDLVALEKAVERMRQAPFDPAPRVEAGRICLRNHQEAEGVRWLLGALQMNPNHAPAHEALADLYEQKGEHERAAKHRRQAGR